MKNVLPYIFMMCGLSAWGQTPIQIQTKTGNYDISDAYSITFEDAGRVQVIKSQSQGEIRVPMSELNQIHFNDTVVSLANQIRNLEGCEIMKTLLFESSSFWSAEQFIPYLNASSITHVFIPNDQAFQSIPVISSHSIPCVLSVTLDESASFPFKGELRMYDSETGEVGDLLESNFSGSQLISFLERLVLNQFAIGNDTYLRTLSGSMIKKTDDGYQGIYELEAARNENQYRKAIHVIQQIPDTENRKCMVTDAVVSDAMDSSYKALEELSPKFLELLKDIPMDLLVKLGLVEGNYDFSIPRYTPDLSYFEFLDSGDQKFRWNSSKLNFTILAPTDEAIDEAFRDGSLLTWTEIEEMAGNMMASSDGDTTELNEVKEKVFDLLAFINRHILFGNLLVDVPENKEIQIATCAVTGNHVSQTVSVQRDAEDGFTVSSGKVVPGTIHYVREAESSAYPIVFSEKMQTGLVMQIDKAIMNN